MTTERKLKRYTSIGQLHSIIENHKIYFSDPIYWEDLNDSELIEEYRKKKNISKVYVLCFSSGDETIHLWKSYANGNDGCCINFNVQYIINLLNRHQIVHKKVEYMEIDKAKHHIFEIDDIPFMKRYPYRIEEEYRAIFLANDSKGFSIEIDPLECITSIVVSHSAQQPHIDKLKTIWKKSTNGHDLSIHKTTIYMNTKWINIFQKIGK